MGAQLIASPPPSPPPSLPPSPASPASPASIRRSVRAGIDGRSRVVVRVVGGRVVHGGGVGRRALTAVATAGGERPNCQGKARDEKGSHGRPTAQPTCRSRASKSARFHALALCRPAPTPIRSPCNDDAGIRLAPDRIPEPAAGIRFAQDRIPEPAGRARVAQDRLPEPDACTPVAQDWCPEPDGRVRVVQDRIPETDGWTRLAQNSLPETDGRLPLVQDRCPEADGCARLAQDRVPETDGCPWWLRNDPCRQMRGARVALALPRTLGELHGSSIQTSQLRRHVANARDNGKHLPHQTRRKGATALSELVDVAGALADDLDRRSRQIDDRRG